MDCLHREDAWICLAALRKETADKIISGYAQSTTALLNLWLNQDMDRGFDIKFRVVRNPQGQRLKYRISPWTPPPSVFDWSPTLVSGRKWSATTFYYCFVLRKSTTHLTSGTFQIHV